MHMAEIPDEPPPLVALDLDKASTESSPPVPLPRRPSGFNREPHVSPTALPRRFNSTAANVLSNSAQSVNFSSLQIHNRPPTRPRPQLERLFDAANQNKRVPTTEISKPNESIQGTDDQGSNVNVQEVQVPDFVIASGFASARRRATSPRPTAANIFREAQTRTPPLINTSTSTLNTHGLATQQTLQPEDSTFVMLPSPTSTQSDESFTSTTSTRSKKPWDKRLFATLARLKRDGSDSNELNADSSSRVDAEGTQPFPASGSQDHTSPRESLDNGYQPRPRSMSTSDAASDAGSRSLSNARGLQYLSIKNFGKKKGDDKSILDPSMFKEPKKDKGSIRIVNMSPIEDQDQPPPAKWYDKLDIDLSSLSEAEIKRQETIFEMIETEADYINDLHLVRDVFIREIQQRQLMTPKEVNSVFSNIEHLTGVNEEFLRSFRERQSAGVIYKVGDIFTTLASYLKMYTLYCGNQPDALQALSKMKDNEELQAFIKSCMTRKECRNLGLTSFLLLPVQRLCKYPLFLRSILKYTPSDHEDFEALTAACTMIESVVETVNERRRFMESQQKMIQIANSLDFQEPFQLVIPTRHFVYEASLPKFTESGKLSERQGFLFNDILIWAKQSSFSRKKYQVKQIIWLTRCVVTDDPSELDGKHTFSISLAGKGRFVFGFNDANAKQAWLRPLKNITSRYLDEQSELHSRGELVGDKEDSDDDKEEGHFREHVRVVSIYSSSRALDGLSLETCLPRTRSDTTASSSSQQSQHEEPKMPPLKRLQSDSSNMFSSKESKHGKNNMPPPLSPRAVMFSSTPSTPTSSEATQSLDGSPSMFLPLDQVIAELSGTDARASNQNNDDGEQTTLMERRTTRSKPPVYPPPRRPLQRHPGSKDLNHADETNSDSSLLPASSSSELKKTEDDNNMQHDNAFTPKPTLQPKPFFSSLQSSSTIVLLEASSPAQVKAAMHAKPLPQLPREPLHPDSPPQILPKPSLSVQQPLSISSIDSVWLSKSPALPGATPAQVLPPLRPKLSSEGSIRMPRLNNEGNNAPPVVPRKFSMPRPMEIPATQPNNSDLTLETESSSNHQQITVDSLTSESSSSVQMKLPPKRPLVLPKPVIT